jgi:3-hydroxybutyryl-CoA dehydratase
MKQVYLQDLKVGDRVESSRLTITETHIVLFAGLTGDFNPMHMDAEAARSTKFGRVIAHGMLCSSISAGLRSPIDDWAIVALLETKRRFLAPVFAGDTLGFSSEILEIRESSTKKDLGTVRMSVILSNQDKKHVQEGEDLILLEKWPGALS